MVISARQRILTPDLFYDEVDETLSKETYNKQVAEERQQQAKLQKELEKDTAALAKAQKKLEKGKGPA